MVFIAVKGEKVDGAKFIPQAIERGVRWWWPSKSWRMSV